MNNPIYYKKLHEDAKPPYKKYITDAGWDLCAIEDVIIRPFHTTKVKTGLAIAIPKNHVGLIWDRSGMGAKGVHRFAGVIDHGYTDEIIVCLNYLDVTDISEPYQVKKGDRIAQLIIQEIPELFFVEMEELPESERGKAGFGSTGN